MTTQHTPSPWGIREGFIVGRFYTDNQRHDICDPRCAPAPECASEMDANMALIAAAPDLLAALQAVADYWEGGDVPADIDAAMRAALKKAKGAA